MVQELFTFHKYITTYKTQDTSLFVEVFTSEEINKLPERLTSSKNILKILNLNFSDNRIALFKRVYLDYFRILLSN